MNTIPTKFMDAIRNWEINFNNDHSARRFVQTVVKHRKQNTDDSFAGLKEAFAKFENKYIEFLAVSDFNSPGILAGDEIKKLREIDCGIY